MIKVFINQKYLTEALLCNYSENKNEYKAEKVLNLKPKCADIKLRITKNFLQHISKLIFQTRKNLHVF